MTRVRRDASLGRRERRKIETRGALLVAALRRFGKDGIYATRVEDVTDDADVGKGAFYNYFDSKNALVTALVRQGVERLKTSELDSARRPKLEDRVAHLTRAHHRFFKAEPAYALVFHQARGLLEVEGDTAAPLRAAFDDYLRLVSCFLFPGLDPRAERLDAAAVVLGTILGYRSIARAASLPQSPATVIRLLVSGVEALS